jgi:hypothetical protein
VGKGVIQMSQIPALPSIVAKILVMFDQTLGIFASVTETASFGACNITVYNVQVNQCGKALIDTLGDLIFYGTQLFGQMLKAMGGVS